MKYLEALAFRLKLKSPASSANKWILAMPDNKDELSQTDKFRDMARELEADEDEAAFEEKVRRVATAPKSDSQGEDDK